MNKRACALLAHPSSQFTAVDWDVAVAMFCSVGSELIEALIP